MASSPCESIAAPAALPGPRSPHRSRRRARSSPHADRRAALLAAALAAVLLPATARADTRITLQNSFVEKFKDRVTVDASLTVDRAMASPRKPAADGDLGAAGRAPEIGLATVAELMNAAGQPEAIALLHQAEQSGQPLALRGVWRLWCEHGGDLPFSQGEPLQPFDTTDPPHVFEIHPLLQAGGQDVSGSLRPIEGYAYRDAGDAFRHFEQLSSHIAAGSGAITITTRMAGFNYVEFLVRLNEDPTHLLADGLAVRAAILDTGGEMLVRERRIVAAAGTAPYSRLRALHKGGVLHVIGLPRIDLAQLSWRIDNSSRLAGVLDWSLPYEMVLVAALDDTPGGPEPAAGGGGAIDGVNPAAAPPPVTGGETPGAARPAAGALVAPATPGSSAEGDVIVTLLQLLGQALPADAVRGACNFSSGQRSYCASLSGPQCDQLGGAFNAGDDCPPAGPAPGPITPPAAPPSAAPPPPAARAPAAPPPGTGEAPPDGAPSSPTAPPTPPPAVRDSASRS